MTEGTRRPADVDSQPVALVTGGAVRVGRAIVESLAAAGYRVVVHYNGSARDASDLVERIRRADGDARSIQADLRDLAAVETLAAEAWDTFDGIDLLVNNAASFREEGLDDLTAEVWAGSLDLNLRAPVFLTRAIGGRMRERGSGCIVNIGDLSGMQAWPGHLAHGISKAGLLHFTRAAARALGPRVRVNAVVPGTVLPPEGTDPGEVQRLAERAPLGRIGAPEDVASAVCYLAESEFVTGEALVVDGGRHIAT